MSRKKETSAPASQCSTEIPRERKYSARQLFVFRFVLAAAILWWLSLLLGALLTSNPPMLEAQLVAQSDGILQVRFVSWQEPSLKVEKCWQNPAKSSGDPCGRITSVPLSHFPLETAFTPHTSYLLPVQETAEGFQILLPQSPVNIPLGTALQREGNGFRMNVPGSLLGRFSLIPVTPITLAELDRALLDLRKKQSAEK